MIIPILSEETKEVFALILYDLKRIEKTMEGMRHDDITIFMTYPLFSRLSFESCGYVKPTVDGAELFGHPVRVAYGDEEEWFISAAHSLTVKKPAM